MSSTRRRRLIGLVALALVAVVSAACSDSDPDSTRAASIADCPARFGCAKFAARFQVINDTDSPITLEAKDIINVLGKDRASLNLTVPARSTSATLSVVLGDDGLQSRDGYIPGRSEGEWLWTIRSGASTTEAAVELAATDDSSIGIQLFEGRAHIGYPVATWGSAYDPVELASTSGVKSFTAVGSTSPEFMRTMPVSTWTFSPPSP